MEPLFECIQPLTFFAKHSILGVSKGWCASGKSKEKLGALLFFFTKMQDCNLCRFLSLLNSIWLHIFTVQWDIINRKLNTRVFHFKLIHPGSWILTYYIKQLPFICSNSSQQFQPNFKYFLWWMWWNPK